MMDSGAISLERTAIAGVHTPGGAGDGGDDRALRPAQEVRGGGPKCRFTQRIPSDPNTGVENGKI